MSNPKFLELCKKLKRLADEGVAGEAEVAEKKLRELMAKHFITMEDLGKVQVKLRKFAVKKFWRKLIFQTCYMVIGNKEFPNRYKDYSGRGVKVELSDLEYLEVQARYNFYKRTLEEDIDLMYSAFINKHGIFPDDTVTTGMPTNMKRWREAERMARMMGNLSDVSYNKQLSSKREFQD